MVARKEIIDKAKKIPPEAPSPVADCHEDFDFDVACRFIKVKDGVTEVKLCKAGNPGMPAPAGDYRWTSSTNIMILGSRTGLMARVKGGNSPSTGREMETVTVTRKEDGKQKTLKLTVVRVTFSGYDGARRVGKYGYDDYQPPIGGAAPAATSDRHHVSVEPQQETFVRVVIEGGAVASDFEFKSKDTAVCRVEVPEASASASAFDLRLTGGNWNTKDTDISVLCRGNGDGSHSCALHVGGSRSARRGASDSPVCFALIQAHVYKRVVVEALVMKAWDSKHPATQLANPAHDYTSSALVNRINEKTLEAMVEFKLTPCPASAQVRDVAFDVDGNGAFTYDIANNGGVELTALRNAFPSGADSKQRVVIVKKMISNYYLASPAEATTSELIINAPINRVYFKLGDALNLPGESGLTITAIQAQGSRTKLTLSGPLVSAHSAGDPLPFPAAGWSSDPIVIVEGTNIPDTEWTIVHECGHSVFRFKDLQDSANTSQATCIMHYQQGWGDHRIRYLPRPIKYNNTTNEEENQWEKIDRTLIP
jgi:hypothetical protein